MKTLHQATLVLALATLAMPTFAFYQVLEETARLEIAPGNIRSEHVIYDATPIPSVDERDYHAFDQILETPTSRQVVQASLERSVPGRNGERHHLALQVFASASGETLSNITQKINYEVVFDIFKLSDFSLYNSLGSTLEKVAPDQTRQLIAFAPAAPNDPEYYYNNDRLARMTPGRYAVTMNVEFRPFDILLATGGTPSFFSSFQVFQSSVPEPSAWLLLAGGVVGVVGVLAMRGRPRQSLAAVS